MSKIKEKMEEVKNVVDVEATEAVTNAGNEATEEFMTIRLPKTAAYALLATGEATEVKEGRNEIAEVETKRKKFPKPTLKQVLIALGVAGAAAGAAGAGYALGKRGEPDDVSFDDVTPKGLPDYNGNYQTTYEKKTEDVDIEI